MNLSLTTMQTVPASVLEDRLENVRELEKIEDGSYEVMKDNLTGEHYLVYHYDHLRIADGGRESYFHFMPMEHDSVIAVLLGEEGYEYPRHWNRPYLRSSGEGTVYVWFDPSGITGYEEAEQTGTVIREKLLSFKAEGRLSEDDIRKLLEDLDKLNS